MWYPGTSIMGVLQRELVRNFGAGKEKCMSCETQVKKIPTSSNVWQEMFSQLRSTGSSLTMACINTAAMVVAPLMTINIPSKVGIATKIANHIFSNVVPKLPIIYSLLFPIWYLIYRRCTNNIGVLLPKDRIEFVVHQVSSALDKNASG